MDKSNENEAFSLRLRTALNNVGIPPRPTGLSRLFNKCSGSRSVTPHAARKWLTGESIPTQDRLRVLARILGVTPDWLRFGGEEVSRDPFAVSGPNMLEMAALYDQLDEKHQRHALDLLRVLVAFRSE